MYCVTENCLRPHVAYTVFLTVEHLWLCRWVNLLLVILGRCTHVNWCSDKFLSSGLCTDTTLPLLMFILRVYSPTHTHTYMHTCTHAHMHTCTHAHTHTHTHTRTHACTHTHTHTQCKGERVLIYLDGFLLILKPLINMYLLAAGLLVCCRDTLGLQHSTHNCLSGYGVEDWEMSLWWRKLVPNAT